jgi:sugar phosphate isomerase/epimerase
MPGPEILPPTLPPVALAAPVLRRSSPAVPRRYSLAHLTLLDVAPPELTEIAARAGYDFVSLRPIGMGNPGEPNYPLATDSQLLRRTRAALAATGIRLLDIELARILAATDVSCYWPALECAAELGARHVLTSAWCEGRDYVLEQFIKLCDYAKPLGLTVDFEFVTFAPFSTLAQTVDLVASSGCTNAGICVDTLHFDRSGHHAQDLDGIPARWLHYAQICDGPQKYSREVDQLKYVAREARLYLGEGGIDIAGIVHKLPSAVPLSIELPHRQRAQQLGHHEYARRCLQSTREYFDRQVDGRAYTANQ